MSQEIVHVHVSGHRGHGHVSSLRRRLCPGGPVPTAALGGIGMGSDGGSAGVRDRHCDRVPDSSQSPNDVWTNTTIGKSITVRGHFVQVANRIPGTNEFSRTVTGFRYLVNKRGEGAVICDVGRIVYDNLGESSSRDVADSTTLPTA